jgi:hypothetical protein
MTAKLNLTPAAQAVLLSTGTNRQGAKPTAVMTTANRAGLQELVNADLIGPGGGLTRKGTIQRELHNEIPF